MRSHSDIVKAAGPDTLAEHFSASIHTVRSWIQRDSIPSDLWAEFAEEGWASLEELAIGARARKPRAGEPEAAAA